MSAPSNEIWLEERPPDPYPTGAFPTEVKTGAVTFIMPATKWHIAPTSP